MMRAAVMSAMAAAAPEMKCPGSSASFHHAACQITVSFENSCDVVYAEMMARIDGKNGWKDPHNGGTYTAGGSKPASYLTATRTTGGAGKYTDKLVFTMQAGSSADSCDVAACSESQVFSVLDMGTNFCNLHDLWAGSQDHIAHAETDLKYTETAGKCTDATKSKCTPSESAELLQDTQVCSAESEACSSAGAGCCDGLTCYEETACIKMSELQVAALPQMKCPGSAAPLHHAACQIAVSFENSCDVVYAEMVARIQGKNGWKDPHNGGTYTQIGGQAGQSLTATRTTGGAGKYTDKLDFTMQAGSSADSCDVAACSESQVFSILDMGTNFCNLHDLWAGSQDHIAHAETDLKYTETAGKCTDATKSKCTPSAVLLA